MFEGRIAGQLGKDRETYVEMNVSSTTQRRKNRNLMQMFGLNETIDQHALVCSCVEEENGFVLRRALVFQVEG